jgi:hemerythrin-like metal-binding protein
MWDPKYSVGIKSIDSQHQRFFEIINQIYDLIHLVYFTREDLLAVINELIEYGNNHMSYEEDYFEKFNYPDTKAHTASHDQFRQQVKNYLSEIQKSDSNFATLAANIAEFTKNWLSEHILDLDHYYIQFFILHDIK